MKKNVRLARFAGNREYVFTLIKELSPLKFKLFVNGDKAILYIICFDYRSYIAFQGLFDTLDSIQN